jgi:serine/threonine protein phosphatase PrpC
MDFVRRVWLGESSLSCSGASSSNKPAQSFSSASSESFRHSQTSRRTTFVSKALGTQHGVCSSGLGYAALSWAGASLMGHRQLQQDAFIVGIESGLPGTAIFGVFDGHGGPSGVQASSVAKAKLHHLIAKRLEGKREADIPEALRAAFVEFDEHLDVTNGESTSHLHWLHPPEVSGYSHAGTCAVVVLVTPTRVFVANIGDSQALAKGGRLTRVHRVSDSKEAARVFWAGGFVSEGRVNGRIVPTRAFGDFRYKAGPSPEKHIVTCIPDVTEIARESVGDWLILASDGVADYIPSETITQICECSSESGATAQTIVDQAIARGSPDNVTCVLIKLGPIAGSARGREPASTTPVVHTPA